MRPKGPYASAGYMGKQDEALARTAPLTTAKGDAQLDVLLKGRSFANARVSACGGRLSRPEPLGIQGTGSSLTQLTGSPGVSKRANMPKDWMVR